MIKPRFCAQRTRAKAAAGDDAGSVLVDALVGLGVIVITLTLASQAVQSGLSTTHRQENVRYAELEARSRLAQVGGDLPLTEGRYGGQDGPLTWTTDVTPSPTSPELVQVQVSVTDGHGRPLASLRSLKSATP